MALPSRLEREAQEAEDFLTGITSESTPGTAQQPEQTGEPAPQTPATPPADSQEVARLTAEIARLQSQLTEENSPTYRHRFEVLQGKYNAELPRLNDRVKELEAKLAEKVATPQAPTTAPEYEGALRDLEEEYGPTTAQSILSVATAIAQEKIDAMQAQFDELQESMRPVGEQVQNLAQSQAATEQQRFWSALDSLVPDWKQINGWGPTNTPQNPKFTQFLDKIVPGADFSYNDLLLHYYGKGNVAKVKEIFDIFRAGNPQQASTPTKGGVEQHIDPSTTGRGTAAPNNQPKTYSQAQVEAFFDSRTKGTFRGTREEALRLENEYTQAMLEGRVQ